MGSLAVTATYTQLVPSWWSSQLWMLALWPLTRKVARQTLPSRPRQTWKILCSRDQRHDPPSKMAARDELIRIILRTKRLTLTNSSVLSSSAAIILPRVSSTVDWPNKESLICTNQTWWKKKNHTTAPTWRLISRGTWSVRNWGRCVLVTMLQTWFSSKRNSVLRSTESKQIRQVAPEEYN